MKEQIAVTDIADLKLKVDALTDINRNREAIELLHTALQFTPQDARLLCRLSLAHLNLNENDLAQRFADDAIVADPLEEWGHRLRSIVLLREGKKRESLEAAQEAVRLSPSEPLAIYSLAQSQRANRLIREARETAERLREISPDDPLAYESLALLAIDEEKYDEAEVHCRKALELNPNSYAAMNNLGLSFLRRNRKREALEYFHQAARLNPTGKVARENLSYTISGYFSRFPKFRVSWIFYFYLVIALARASVTIPLLAGIGVIVTIGIFFVSRYVKLRELPPEVRSFVSNIRRRQRMQAIKRSFLGTLYVLTVLVIITCLLICLIWVLILLEQENMRTFDRFLFTSFCGVSAFLLWKLAIPKLNELRNMKEEDF